MRAGWLVLVAAALAGCGRFGYEIQGDAGAAGDAAGIHGGGCESGLPAFPGAQGFGSCTIGGRGGQVIEVTSLASDGPGTLREACAVSGPRIIVFRVGGTIQITEDLEVSEPFVTIAGQTAPGDGIQVRGAGLVVETHDVVVRGLRLRAGDAADGPAPEVRHAGLVSDEEVAPYNVVFDHCSFQWAIDENLSTWAPAAAITVQWSLIAEGLNDSIHPDGVHSRGFLIGAHSHYVSVHHNLFAHNHASSPQQLGSSSSEIVNNVVYDWGSSATVLSDADGDGPIHANVIGNYYIPGLNGTDKGIDCSSRLAAGLRLYVQGNVGPGRETDSGDDWLAVDGDEAAYRWPAPAADQSGITTTSALDAYEPVLAGAGALRPARDSVDARIVQSVRDRTGTIVDSQDDVGGWPTLADGTPPADSDHDGMPDDWEVARGLDPGDPSDGPRDRDGDGYSNVEEYLNGLFGG